MSAPYRVAITGIAAITPVGNGPDGLWNGVRSGCSAVKRLTRFDPDPFRSQLAAQVDDFDPQAFLSTKQARRLDRFSQMAVAAGRCALEDARLCLPEDVRDCMGCYIGSALGGVAFAEEQHRAFTVGGLSAVNPNLALAVFGGAAACNVAIELGLRGPSQANSNSCASGAIAIGEAFRLVRAGEAPIMLAGGVETPLAPLTFGSFALIKAMSTASACPGAAPRPFDGQRDGFVIGEGAAMLVLEEFDHARVRGARIYAEVGGYASTNDAHHMLAPMPDGAQAARCVTLALRTAGLQSDDVDYVNAHASATPIGDRAEAAALRQALGEHAASVPVSGTKGAYGHPLGASGAIEAALCGLAIQRCYLPGTVNLQAAEPELGLNILGPAGQAAEPRAVLSTSFGFGGINAALVLTQPD